MQYLQLHFSRFGAASCKTVVIYSCRDASTAAIRPAPAAPVPGGVPTPFAAAPTPSTSSPKPFINSAASVSPVSKPSNRVPSPIVFPPPLPSVQDFNFQPTAKPHVQFRPAEASVFDEHDEELTAIANQVTLCGFSNGQLEIR